MAWVLNKNTFYKQLSHKWFISMKFGIFICKQIFKEKHKNNVEISAGTNIFVIWSRKKNII